MGIKNIDTSIDRDITSEENKEIAQNYAEKEGYNNIGEIVNKARTMMNDERTSLMGRQLAEKTVSELALLILYQELLQSPLGEIYDLVDRTNDGFIKNGNAKTYNAMLGTGSDTYQPNMFIPTKQSVKKLEDYTLQIYNAANELNPKAFQFKKEITLQPKEWIPYFLDGKLNVFMNNLREQLRITKKIFLSNKLFDLITSNTPYKTIQGTGVNMFDCLLEILPEIDRMQEYNAMYNNSQSKYLQISNPKDIVIVASTNVISKIKNGIKTQLFNAELLGAKGKSLDEVNLISFGNKIEMTNGDTINEDTGTPWLDDNTILIFDISKIKTVFQVNEIGIQDFASNMTKYLVLHLWGAMDILPWCKFIKYTNNNLSVLP